MNYRLTMIQVFVSFLKFLCILNNNHCLEPDIQVTVGNQLLPQKAESAEETMGFWIVTMLLNSNSTNKVGILISRPLLLPKKKCISFQLHISFLPHKDIQVSWIRKCELPIDMLPMNISLVTDYLKFPSDGQSTTPTYFPAFCPLYWLPSL